MPLTLFDKTLSSDWCDDVGFVGLHALRWNGNIFSPCFQVRDIIPHIHVNLWVSRLLEVRSTKSPPNEVETLFHTPHSH